jgi:hypothetical protein
MIFWPSNTSGADYYAMLKRLHAFLKPKTYVEIGTREGRSFRLARSATHAVGIDPNPLLVGPVPPGVKVFATTSDLFFASHDLREELGGSPVDLAFIDGMHLFEFALRDFINLEKHACRASTILVHDCYPENAATATRKRTTQIWSGDVWKLLLCLKKYRPDLELATVDVPPTGLGIIRNLNPASRVLPSVLEEACAEFVPCEFDRIAQDKATQLSRVDNDWKQVRALFPARRKPRVFGVLPRFGFAGGTMVPRASQPTPSTGRPAGWARPKPKALGVLLCYNDADILSDCLEALLVNNHDLVVWDHGSDDGTSEVLDQYAPYLRERKLVPRNFDFHKLHGAMSRNLLQNYCAHYDWISWPDQDEILEGPARDRSYYGYISEVVDSEYDWVEFRNFNFWFTSEDDPSVLSPTKRILRYSLRPKGAPRIRAWRASVTNIRCFNHNALHGKKYPRLFNLRHYQMRSAQQMLKRLNKDRLNIQNCGASLYYNHMKENMQSLVIPPEHLYLDNGKSELNCEPIFDWESLYFGPPAVTGQVATAAA